MKSNGATSAAPGAGAALPEAAGSEAMLRTILDNVPAMIVRCDLSGRITYVNRTLPGVERGQIVGRQAADFVAPDLAGDVQEFLAAVAASGQPQQREYPALRPDGRPAVLSCRVAPMRDGRSVTGLVGIVTDVTERRRIESQVRHYSDIVANIQIGLYVYRLESGPEGHTLRGVSANPASEQLTGIRAAEFVGRTQDELFPRLRQAGLVEMALRVHQTREAMLVDDFWYGDERLPRNAWQFTLFPLAEDCIGVSFENVTERCEAADALRASEELNSMILAAVPAGIVQVDREGRVVSANLLARQFLGYSFDELTQRTLADFEPQTFWEDGTPCPAADYPVSRCLETNLPQSAVTIGVVQRQGSLRWGLFSAVPLTDPHVGDCRGAVVTFLDITERKRTEEHARQLQHQLAHVARLTTMGEMASGLAHELNQPLAAIIAYADACHEMQESGRMPPAQLGEVLRSISAQAERAGKIIQRLRKLVKRSAPVRASIRVNDAVREVAALFESDAARAGVVVRFDLDDRLPPAHADLIQIEQVLVNLIRNGLEAMTDRPAGRRQLVIASRSAPDGHIDVSIRDHGRGVAPEEVPHLFEPFFTTKPDGLGMGLSISRSIVEAHGGRLWLTPHPEGGMTARFQLPIGDGRLPYVSGTHRIHRG